MVGPFALMALMTVAVAVSTIPGLPLSLATGAAHGPFGGAVYALTGTELGADAQMNEEHCGWCGKPVE